MRQPQFLGEQVQHAVVLLGVFGRQRQVVGGVLQRVQVAFARQPGRFGAGIPASDLQQFGAQRVQAGAALGGNAELAGTGRKRCG